MGLHYNYSCIGDKCTQGLAENRVDWGDKTMDLFSCYPSINSVMINNNNK